MEDGEKMEDEEKNGELYEKNNVNFLIEGSTILPGIIILNGKTFGRDKNKNSKFRYKCIPYNKNLPHLLISYENKRSTFCKQIINKFVLFKYIDYNEKHPVGSLVDIIGEVTDFDAFNKYNLYCKEIFQSIKHFENKVNRSFKKLSSSSINLVNGIKNINLKIEERLGDNIITIDPFLSKDLDDGVGIKGNYLSIYIANVPLILNYLNLWDISERVSTIYLPNKKIVMLPLLLSENICSLLEGEERFAFCMDIEIDELNESIGIIKFESTLIKVKKNYSYEEIDNIRENNSVEERENIENIFSKTKVLLKNFPFIEKINNSHQLVEFLMIFMNYHTAIKMLPFKTGIYRSIKINKMTSLNNLLLDKNFSKSTLNFLKIWKSSSGNYTNYEDRSGHDLIGNGIDSYIHITSPIRRLVDLLNLTKFQQIFGMLNLIDEGTNFYNKWEQKIEYINKSMKSIKKLQQESLLLHSCINFSEFLEKQYDGVILEKLNQKDKYTEYIVYLPAIKLVTTLKEVKELKKFKEEEEKEMEEFSSYKFILYMIEEEETLKKKVRLERVLSKT